MNKLVDARAAANAAAKHLAPYCQHIEIAGSVRRGKPFVKDIELVAVAGKELWSFLDNRVLHGTIEKATYLDRNGRTTYRWGDKYRGILWAGVKIEIFLTDADNWGYQFWLRTGPGDANTAVMVALTKKHAPFRFRDGQCYALSPISLPREQRKIRVPDEDTLFRLLGVPYIEPKDRTKWRYEKAIYSESHRWGLE